MNNLLVSEKTSIFFIFKDNFRMALVSFKNLERFIQDKFGKHFVIG